MTEKVPPMIVEALAKKDLIVLGGTRVGSSSGGFFAQPTRETIDNCELWNVVVGKPPAFGFYGRNSLTERRAVLVEMPVKPGIEMSFDGVLVDEWN